MMNWNSNDTKYIIKRIILYFIIAGIVFFAGQSCAKAITQTDYIQDPSVNSFVGITSGNTFRNYRVVNAAGSPHEPFKNYGEGYIIFNMQLQYNNAGTTLPNSIQVANDGDVFLCDIGTTIGYNDSTTQRLIITAKCQVNFRNNHGLKSIYFDRPAGNGDLMIWLSDIVTFVGNNQDANAIIVGQQSAINSQIQNDNTNTQAIQNTITNATQQQVTAINNNTTAINNQTQAINNQTEWFEEQHDPLIDTGFLDVMGDLITTNDSDVVRQFIMIPFNLFVQIYNACTSNTCSALTLGTLYGTTLTLPCINWTTLVGSAIANTIDIIFSACLIFGMYRMIKHMINKIFTLSSTITDECGVEVFN